MLRGGSLEHTYYVNLYSMTPSVNIENADVNMDPPRHSIRHQERAEDDDIGAIKIALGKTSPSTVTAIRCPLKHRFVHFTPLMSDSLNVNFNKHQQNFKKHQETNTNKISND